MFSRAASPLSPPSARGKRCDSASKRCDSALSNRSTAPPSRPCSSLGRGPSRNSPSPGGDALWHEDAQWPVKEGGLTSLPGINGSLDLDLDIARRKLVEPAEASESKARKLRADVLLQSIADKTSEPEAKPETPRRRGALFEALTPERISPLVKGDCTAAKSRQSVLQWSFRVSKEEIKDRLDLLDQSFYDQDHREAVYLRREEDADEDSLLERFMQLYVSSGIKNWGQATHPANLDFWLQQEGGVARTCELLLALEVLNFYRWICRLSRLQVDSFLQELADVFLQVIQKRSDRPLCKATEDHLALAAAVEEFRDSEGLRMAILSHLPSAVDAAREIFSGLPGAATSDGGPKLLQGRAEIKLPLKSQMSLEPYLPLFSLVGNARKASKSSRASFSSTEEKRAFGVRMEHVPNGPPASLPPPPGKSRSGEPFHSSGRRSHCWGDIRGVVTLRRTMLDPRVFSVGVMRRGCNFCIVCPADIFDGQPPEDIHEEPPPEDDFLDPDNTGKDAVQEQKTRAVMSKEFKQLLKWRENEPWKKLVKQKAKGPDANRNRMEEKLTSLDENVDLDDMEGWQVQRSTVVDDCPEEIAFARRTQDTQDAQTRTEHALRREGKLVETKSAKKRFDHFLQEEELEEPLMVCFPPPGFVPVEMLCEAELMPWTISPDPFRLSPRLDCKVQVFRVKIDHSASTAERLSEVPLLNFCVDCSDTQGVCIIFTPNLCVQAGEDYEVVLSGLAHRDTPAKAACNLQYFLSFASFGRHHQDQPALSWRAAQWLSRLQTPSIWEEVIFTSGDAVERLDTERLASAKRVTTNTPRKGGLKSGIKSKAINDGPMDEVKKPSRLIQLRFEEIKAPPTSFDQKRPPPIGVVKHPQGERGERGDRSRQSYHIEAKGNEVMLSLLHPSTVVIKATLHCFLKSQAKWEHCTHGVWQMCFNEPSTEARDDYDGPEARHKRQNRVVVTVMLPTFGQYELRFQWGHVPLTATDAGLCRMVQCGVAQYEHPLRISLRCPAQEGDFKHLVPSLLHTSMVKYGYPVKHPLAEQFGMTLLQPLRHRLRRGQEVRFLVFSTQTMEASPPGDATASRGEGHNRRGSHLAEVLAEDGSGPKPTSEALRHRIRGALKPCMRSGTSKGPARIAAVMGNWQRVQVLARRLLSTDPTSPAEVHEGLVKLQPEDMAQSIQLIVFQVGSDMALDEFLAHRVKEGKDKEPFFRKDVPFEGAPVLGSTPRPNYWVLAEYAVDSLSTALPYDEEEMLKPPPPPPDAIELIRNLEVGRSVKLEHQGSMSEVPEKSASKASVASAYAG